jgi:hypothetical protein
MLATIAAAATIIISTRCADFKRLLREWRAIRTSESVGWELQTVCSVLRTCPVIQKYPRSWETAFTLKVFPSRLGLHSTGSGTKVAWTQGRSAIMQLSIEDDAYFFAGRKRRLQQ